MEIEDSIKLIIDRVMEILKEDEIKGTKDILFLCKEEDKERYSLFIPDWSGIRFIGEEKYGFKTIILPCLSNKDLIDIVSGAGETRESIIVVNGIMEGKRIIILEEGIYFKRFKDSCNPNFYNMMENYIGRIKSFGIIFAKGEDLEKHIKHIKNEEPYYGLNKTLITQSDLENIILSNGLIIKINKNATITPLAMDTIKEKQWIISRTDT